MKARFFNYLVNTYVDYYLDVHYTFIEEAIDNSIKDLGITGYNVANAEKMHRHIIENYI